MKLRDKVLFYLMRHQLARNRRFKDLHKGQSCYIFGNGASLKSMSLDRFADKIAIGCNSLFLHKDFDRLNCLYYQIPAPLCFYPYKTYYGKFQRNYLGDLYREQIRRHKNTNFFTSISNCLNMRGNNVFYIHHFGSRDWDINKSEMDGAFSFMAGATYAMIGAAIYLGFESAVLVGIDYTFFPKHMFHFFEKGPGVVIEGSDDAGYCGSFFEACRQKINLTTITLDGVRSNMDFKTYADYVGLSQHYRENTEVVEKRSLDYLNKQGFYRVY